MSLSRLPAGAGDAAPLTLALVDGVNETSLANGGVDGRGADVRVPRELADDRGVGARVGDMRAEGVPEHAVVPTSAQARLCRPARYAETGEKACAHWDVGVVDVGITRVIVVILS